MSSRPRAAVDERVLLIPCAGERMVGVLAQPLVDASPIGVVVVVGGPQYRAGSHRQFVGLTRALAAAGHTALRFDVRGMGDSSGALPDFEHIGPDIGAAIDALLQQAPGVRRVVLWGLCDGASAALMYLQQHPDARVSGLCLVNPWVRSAQTLARAHVKHYYLQRLRDRAFWRKLFSGGIAWDAAKELLHALGQARRPTPLAAPSSFQQRMLEGWQRHEGRTLVVLSGNDYTAQEFAEHVASHPPWQQLMARAGNLRQEVAEADHTFSAAPAQAALEALTARWLAEPAAAAAPAPQRP